MYVVRPVRPTFGREPEGLGLFWLIPIIAAAAGTIGSAVATRLISGPSSPSQKQIEEQLKLQQRLEIEKMVTQQQLQQQQVEQIKQLAIPALGIAAVVMLLR